MTPKLPTLGEGGGDCGVVDGKKISHWWNADNGRININVSIELHSIVLSERPLTVCKTKLMIELLLYVL